MSRWWSVVGLALIFLVTSGQSGCEDKGTSTDLLLSQAQVLSRDPAPEELFFSQDYPGAKNPNIGDFDIEWDLSYRRQIALGDLWSFQLTWAIFRVFNDSGGTPSLVAEKLVPITGTGIGTLGLSLSQILDDEGYTAETPEEFRVRVGVTGNLTLGDKKTLRNARKLFRRGGEPYETGAGQLSALAMTTRVIDQSDGSIVAEWWQHYPVFADDAYELSLW